MTNELLHATGIGKSYGQTRALDGVDITVDRSSVVALLGSNGSGKSTLTRILTGAAAPDAGEIRFDGQAVSLGSPSAAQKLGIVAVAQELSLIGGMTIAENIWLGADSRLRRERRFTQVRHRETQRLLALFAGVVRSSLTPSTVVATLSPDEWQIVEILKAVAREPKLLILDEATSTLDRQQAARLFELMRSWCEQGTGIIFVSHRMDEVFQISDRVCVIRGGMQVHAGPIAGATPSMLVEAMTGHRATTEAATLKSKIGRPTLQAEGLTGNGFRAVSLTVHEGEVLGLGGLQRQGQSSVLRALGGGSAWRGRLRWQNREVAYRTQTRAIAMGITYVAGDRAEQGLFSRSIMENILAGSWRALGTPLRWAMATARASRYARDLDVRMSRISAPLSSLSGGNAQKVLLARGLANDPRVLLLDDPTKGVDVATKSQIYQILRELRARGLSIVIYSSEDDELLAISDRILVFHDGAIVTELVGDSMKIGKLVSASMGIVSEQGEDLS